jgi:hypothetical protein
MRSHPDNKTINYPMSFPTVYLVKSWQVQASSQIQTTWLTVLLCQMVSGGPWNKTLNL